MRGNVILVDAPRKLKLLRLSDLICRHVSPSVSSVRVFQWNAGGLSQAKKHELAKNLATYDIDVFTVMEAGWKYTRIYNPQRRLRVLVEKCRIDSSQRQLCKLL
ncbi:hypothetical protein TNCV_1581551 [Trichonephila clavipes]|nr:hypothetical protein TNCV_1581551 [Trichonephila clavipes]